VSGVSDPERERQALLRALPSVDRLAALVMEPDGDGWQGATPAEAVVAARTAIEERRRELLADGQVEPGGETAREPVEREPVERALVERSLVERARERLGPTLRRVLNGTGVVIHTNLGRAPLAEAAAQAVSGAARGYANLELDLRSGRRGSRHEHVRELICELTGAEDALAVNNGAGAALLALAATVPAGGAVAVSRGQLVEIGGGFRVPEVLAQAGARLVEVGTTNRTRLADYRRAIEQEGVAAVLRVHQSNFRTVGFVAEAEIEELCGLGVPVIDDLGSGALAEGLAQLAEEPPVRRSLAAGATLVCFSADKLLGGPQGGILAGSAEAIAACRSHPLARALRIGRLPLAGLAATLALYRDPQRALREIPVLAMLDAREETLRARAEKLAQATGGEEVRAVARVGGGALPLLELEGPAVALGREGLTPEELAGALRAGDPPLIARIADGRVLVDPRTLTDDEVEVAARVIGRALQAVGGSTS
jgi:L-seryl-tRNA(Ser) seleniumtransferase